MMECCSHSHFEIPHSLSSTKNHDFCECVAGNKEMHLSLLQESLASADLPQLKADASNPNKDCTICLRDVYNAGGENTSNLHDFNRSLSDKLKFEYKVYALGGIPDPQHGHWQYHRFSPSKSYSLDTNHAIENCESATRFVVSSLEDEFYVDAGIRIPQQLTTSDFTPLPSRIPNLRDTLFKNRSISINTNLQNISQSVSQKEMKTECKASPESANGSLESKSNFTATHKVVTKTSNASTTSKSLVSSNVMTKKTFIPSTINKRNSGVLSAKVEHQTQQTSKGKLNLTNKQKPAVNVTTTNRRHSYMEGDKVVKMKFGDIAEGKKVSSLSENKRHSYLERLQVSALDDGAENSNENVTTKKLNTRGQNLSDAKLSTTTVTNRRHSYNSVVQNNRGDTNVPVIKRGAESNRHSIGPETCKSMLNSQSQIKRGTSLDRETGTDVTGIGSAVKRWSTITPSNVKHTVQRHSSLERGDMDRLSIQVKVQGKKVENKFLSANVQKELITFSSTDGKTVGKKIDMNKIEYSRNTQRELLSLDDAITSSKGNHASKIPRGGGTSCHSSPGNSRASSPTILVCGNSSRLRRRTAPNSRASSPTGAEKLQQRLSLGSLNCYMGSLKLVEPGASRLPVR